MLAPTEVADRVEIERALAAYSHAIDTHDWDLLDSVFLADADIDYRESVPHRGDLAYTKEWLSRMTRAGTYYHLLGLPWISISGDTAYTRTACINPMPLRDGRDGRRFVGHWYADDWMRTPAGWRIRARLYSACYQLRLESSGPSAASAGGSASGTPLTADETLRIHDLYARYNQALDSGDADTYVACFLPDGRLVRDGATVTGAAELADFAAAAATDRLQHFVSNIAVDGLLIGSADGFATGRADVLVLSQRADSPSLVAAGRYADQLRCGPDGWRFAERRYETAR
jgi:ketosteroid isomerase-like protein